MLTILDGIALAAIVLLILFAIALINHEIQAERIGSWKPAREQRKNRRRMAA